MQSNSKWLIVFCAFLVVCVGVGAFLIKIYFFQDDINKEFEVDNGTTIKEKYNYNEFQLIDVSTEVLIRRYFIDFKQKMLNEPEEAYKLLDSKTKEKYSDYFSFKTYIDNNIDYIEAITIKGYTTKKLKNSNVYKVIDQYDNRYTFTAKAVMVYKVTLEFDNETSSIFD